MDFNSADEATKVKMLKEKFVKDGHYQHFMKLIEDRLSENIQAEVYDLCLKETEKRVRSLNIFMF